ncbi:MAG TPA: TIGR04282 family arsenosugar biosynthesis glycosyltransferase [Balneolales bacterium]|nr:TIGR04282 family arsenosugar biosynthesis glycosyltransferase [Balneolales bacterium]
MTARIKYNEALIIFTKIAELGKVKTRLAKSIGENRALEVYRELMEHTRDITMDLNVDRRVYFTPSPPDKHQIWDKEHYDYFQQSDGDLGFRMSQAFKETFEQGYDKVIIIGCDCAELTSDILRKAFEELDHADFIIGPAKDGGYYLLGMNEYEPSIFEDKEWSTETVFEDTISDLIDRKKIWYELPILSDVDTEEDLRRVQFLIKQRKLREMT